MYKKTITYKDYNGEDRTEDFYFHLNQAELTKMQLEIPGGLTGMIDRITQRKSGPDIMEVFNTLIEKSYGVKSPDGRKFVKSKEILDDFLQTEAYNVFFMELVTSADAASEFFNKIIPDMSAFEEKAKAEMAKIEATK
jgi:hypothetical protein